MSGAAPGRACPLRYRHGPRAIARAPERAARTLYVVGGLYGNVQALEAVEAMAAAESPAATLCFNGDFHWFDVSDAAFAEVSGRVLAHHATLGNVEAELDAPGDEAGCGCAYPASVDAATVERSNLIHARLKATARHHPALLAQLAVLPMVARWKVAGCRVGVVHGDADSLAGWRFDAAALDDPAALPWLRDAFEAAEVDLFASTHTCLPALRRVAPAPGSAGGMVANNGSAGLPNFAGDPAGLCTRIGETPSPHPALGETVVAGAHVALLPIRHDAARWQAGFLAQWPPGSAAWTSYFDRIVRGPDYAPARALGGAAG